MIKFDRQGFLGDGFYQAQENKIGVVGICGGGSHVVMQLCHMGFINLVLVDFDILEVSNLKRMVLGKKSDIGKLKVDIAKNYASDVNENDESLAISKRWQDCVEELRNCRFIFSCMDSLQEREQLEMFCRRNNIIMIDVGMAVQEIEKNNYSISGQVFISAPGKVCMKCFDFFNPKNDPAGEYGDAGPLPQVVFTNGILASNAINSFVKMVSESYGEKIPSFYKVYSSEHDDFTDHPLLENLENKTCSHY